MSDERRRFLLRIALIALGMTFILGFSILTVIWPSGWTWGHGHSPYLTMMVGLYATLGVFLLIASRDPEAHRSLIWFTIWSSIVHAAIMAVQSVSEPDEHEHLMADVPALVLAALVLTILMPRRSRVEVRSANAKNN